MKEEIIPTIIRSRRRTLALYVTADASLVVRAPQRMPLRTIYDFIQEKLSWIIKKQHRIRQIQAQVAAKEFVDGEEFLFLGAHTVLRIVDNQAVPLVLNGNEFCLSRAHKENAREIFVEWYRQKASAYFQERVDLYARLAGVRCERIKISNAKRQWGCCSADDTLRFSWRLMMGAPDVIDYVVVHEVAHLLVRNHSRRFWNTVAALLPGYKEQRKWMRSFGALLTL